MAKKLFTTIYGRNLVGELKNIVQRPYLVVTMEDLWDRFKGEFDDDCIVHFVKTLEYDEIMAEVERLPKFEAVIGLAEARRWTMPRWRRGRPICRFTRCRPPSRPTRCSGIARGCASTAW
ncbi:MAG: hypothetical protein ACLTT1_20275 [[Clostridium] scindens]